MCGIVGVVSKTNSTLNIAVEALKRLEYRGYDSFGVSVLHPGHPGLISTKKAVGSVIEHSGNHFFDSVSDGKITIAHTRWATHGGVTEKNAHPHLSFDGAFSLVHNGVIENHRELREKLLATGIKFESETDTEVVAHLLAFHFGETGDILESLRRTIVQIHGEYAIAFTTIHDQDHIYGVRFKSPLGFGQTEELGMIASDQRAIGPLTPNMTFLEDGDVLVLSAESASVYNLHANGSLAPVERKVISLPWAKDSSELNGYPHHMVKEIHEAEAAVQNAFSLSEEVLNAVVEDLGGKDISITGAGSAFYVSQIGQYFFSQLADTYTRVHPSDEIRSLVSFNGHDHLIAVSQSGETFDTLEAVREALNSGSTVTSINNVYGSSCQRIAQYPIFQGAGTETCVLSTKSIVSQVLILYRLAKLLGRKRNLITPAEYDAMSNGEKDFGKILQVLFEEQEEHIKSIGSRNKLVDNWFFIGRGVHYPVAMESALKFKEVSYLHAEGMPAGFFKHGTISLIDNRFFTVAFLPGKETDPDTYRFTLSNISEIQARGGKIIAIGHDADISKDIGQIQDYIALPSINRYLDPVLELITGQLLAYYCAASLGRNIDKPRALAKSVTVR
jgi:glucosamine--fructose-6-phosphate aminotransferase (isomerizing)